MGLKALLSKVLRGRKKVEETLVKYEFGMPVPIHSSLKHKIISDYAEKLQISTLVETGTYLGAGIDACLQFFDHIYSIEVDHQLAERAKAKYSTNEKVKIIEGDSGKELASLITELKSPVIFWLDGHYSGGITGKGEKNTPIMKELSAIVAHPIKGHLILIDDARCFIGEFDYPSLFEIYEWVKAIDPNYKINVKDDIIRIGYAI